MFDKENETEQVLNYVLENSKNIKEIINLAFNISSLEEVKREIISCRQQWVKEIYSFHIEKESIRESVENYLDKDFNNFDISSHIKKISDKHTQIGNKNIACYVDSEEYNYKISLIFIYII